MENSVTILARARREVLDLKDSIEAVKSEIEKKYGKELKDLNEELSLAQAQVAEEEKLIRDTALKAYQADGDKHPHPAITVKVFTKLGYDAEVAFAYCIQHLQSALKMDRRKFEKVAKVVEPDFVEVTQEPKATIARDLSEYE